MPAVMPPNSVDTKATIHTKQSRLSTFHRCTGVLKSISGGNVVSTMPPSTAFGMVVTKAPTFGNYRISVLGFADQRGNAEANERLSLRRAGAVSNYMRQTGLIQPGRVLAPSAMGEGTTAPGEAAPTSDEEARRVVVRVVTPKGQLKQ